MNHTLKKKVILYEIVFSVPNFSPVSLQSKLKLQSPFEENDRKTAALKSDRDFFSEKSDQNLESCRNSFSTEFLPA